MDEVKDQLIKDNHQLLLPVIDKMESRVLEVRTCECITYIHVHVLIFRLLNVVR